MAHFRNSVTTYRSETTLLYYFFGETVRISPNSTVMYYILARINKVNIKKVFERIDLQN